MPNPNQPFGFRPTTRTRSGGTVEILPFTKDASAGTIRANDAVIAEADGFIAPAANVADVLLGIAMTPKATGVISEHLVAISPDLVMEVQMSGSTVEADRFLNADPIYSGTPVGDQSAHALDSSTQAVTGTLGFTIEDRVPRDDNDWGSYVVVLATFNCKHRGVTGPGVVGI